MTVHNRSDTRSEYPYYRAWIRWNYGGHVLCGVTAQASPGGLLLFDRLEAALAAGSVRAVTLHLVFVDSSGMGTSARFFSISAASKKLSCSAHKRMP
jgi:hypothetical protein